MPPRSTARPLIFVVDDHAGSLTALQVALEPLQLDVVGAKSAESATTQLSDLRPLLIITDLRMRGASGADFIAWLRGTQEHRSVPVIIVSGVDHEDGALRKAMTLSDVYFLQKPYSPADLRALITRLVAPPLSV